ncbi:MauE/DoxX family redox-associated membrane protein [Corynebacterium choanae]|nr:MauE/DoxX family redox-associated membrane protein [Corynebacterium choanae]
MNLRNSTLLHWVSAISRFGLALVWLVSGGSKIIDPLATKQSIYAYQLFSPQMVNFIGTALPPVEIALGVMLLIGLLIRPVGAISAVIFVGFIAGIASAWARGLTIDCGCFGTGGDNPNVTGWTYAGEILRDLLFVAMAIVCVWRPFQRFAFPQLSTRRT